MAKNIEPTETVAEKEPATAFAISLDEFCQRLSSQKKSPEIISGFYHAQRVAGNLSKSDTEYAADFAAFIKQPV